MNRQYGPLVCAAAGAVITPTTHQASRVTAISLFIPVSSWSARAMPGHTADASRPLDGFGERSREPACGGGASSGIERPDLDPPAPDVEFLDHVVGSERANGARLGMRAF